MSRGRLPAGVGLLAAAVMLSTSCELAKYPLVSSLPPVPLPESGDPPKRVARLSYLEAPVSFRAAGTEGWAPALLNRPLSDGDDLWTGTGARAELHLGLAAIRLSASTSFDILDLDDMSAQFKITQGLICIRVRRMDPGETYEIDTPNSAITLLRAGDYRVEVQAEEGITRLTARSGEAHVAGVAQSFVVHAPQQARIPGAGGAAYQIVPAQGMDAFDEFCQARDRREDEVQSSRYVSPEAIGYNDLDDFGTWQDAPSWGPVWSPRNVPDTWAPYRFGRWLWIEPWGWTWVDDAPWGFAPFHYGRWVFVDGSWAWLPGPRHVRPVYVAAAVMFVGGGRRDFRYFLWIGRADVAWFPLGPGETYVPPYKCTRGYFTDINITNTTIRGPIDIAPKDRARLKYSNQTLPGAITAVAKESFVGGGPIGRVALAVPPRTARVAHATGSAAPMVPILASVSPGIASTTVQPPPAVQDQPVLVWRVPEPAPVPFERTLPALNGHPGRSPDRAWLDEMRRTEPTPRADVRLVQPTSREVGPPTAPPAPAEPTAEKRRARTIQKEIRRERKRASKPPLPERPPE